MMKGFEGYSATAIMEETSNSFFLTDDDVVQISPETEYSSLNVNYPESMQTVGMNKKSSFCLMNWEEELTIRSTEEFSKKLGCSLDTEIKVISIFGKTGDGKSHTMNNTFFEGADVFRMSSEQGCCTKGVWAAYQKPMKILCLDTEGIPGSSAQDNQRTRMLLKVLGISDIVIYRTRSEKLQDDMFLFLGNASKAFCDHFAEALKSMGLPRLPEALGPSVIIFHETMNTNVLMSTVDETAEDKIRKTFEQKNLNLKAFSSLKYVGVQTRRTPTNYKILENELWKELENNDKRIARTSKVIFETFQGLNSKFYSKPDMKPMLTYSDQIFMCGIQCEICGISCKRSMRHEGQKHANIQSCFYNPQYENKVLLCKNCMSNGKEIIVNQLTQTAKEEQSWYSFAKSLWTGIIINCPNCGEIYRSTWLENKPNDDIVKTEVIHVWRDDVIIAKGPKNPGQMVIDGISYFTDTVCSYTAQPTKSVKDWVTDKVAPNYWKPNHKIINCKKCLLNFDKMARSKHHCRHCGEGFCNTCTQHKMPVPSRGWNEPVRVCDECREKLQQEEGGNLGNDETDIIVRKYGEAVINTLKPVVSVIEYSKDFVKDKTRPDYWVPDEKSPNCAICGLVFGDINESISFTTTSTVSTSSTSSSTSSKRHNIKTSNCTPDYKRHHCRACGRAICHPCSSSESTVPEKGWTYNVRVCNDCIEERKQKKE